MTDTSNNMISVEMTETEYNHYLAYKQRNSSLKSYLKTYHQSDEGKKKRKIAQKKYREKMKQVKIKEKIQKTKAELQEKLKALEELETQDANGDPLLF